MANEAQPHCDVICLPVFGHIIYVCPPKDYKNEPIKINAAVIQFIIEAYRFWRHSFTYIGKETEVGGGQNLLFFTGLQYL